MKISDCFRWRYILLFTLVGPFVGGAAYLLIATVLAHADGDIGLPVLVVFAMAYMFGIVPALITGLITLPIFSVLPDKFHQSWWVHSFVAATVGACVSMVFYLFIAPSNIIFLSALGALSAFACSFIYSRSSTA